MPLHFRPLPAVLRTVSTLRGICRVSTSMVRGSSNLSIPTVPTNSVSCVDVGSVPSPWPFRFIMGQARCAWVGLPNAGCAQRHDSRTRLRREDGMKGGPRSSTRRIHVWSRPCPLRSIAVTSRCVTISYSVLPFSTGSLATSCDAPSTESTPRRAVLHPHTNVKLTPSFLRSRI